MPKQTSPWGCFRINFGSFQRHYRHKANDGRLERRQGWGGGREKKTLFRRSGNETRENCSTHCKSIRRRGRGMGFYLKIAFSGNYNHDRSKPFSYYTHLERFWNRVRDCNKRPFSQLFLTKSPISRRITGDLTALWKAFPILINGINS